jgi:MarR family transcriptional regulator, organic hydroperoxide resistance regulator
MPTRDGEVTKAAQELNLPADSPGFTLWRVSNAWQRAVRGALQPWGLTHAQAVVLATIDWIGGGGRVKQYEVAELAGMDPMTTSQVVRALEEKELVKRARHPEDARAVTVGLTAKGKKTLSKATKAVQSIDQQFFEAAGKHQKGLVAGLAALVQG